MLCCCCFLNWLGCFSSISHEKVQAFFSLQSIFHFNLFIIEHKCHPWNPWIMSRQEEPATGCQENSGLDVLVCKKLKI